jgi:exonuclease III
MDIGPSKEKDNDMTMATWNVRSLYSAGMLKQLKIQMEKYRIDIISIKEIRRKGKGIMDTGNFTLFYSGHVSNTFGTGFLVNRKYKWAVINFEAIDERICLLRIKGKFNNMTIICVHTPTKKKKK